MNTGRPLWLMLLSLPLLTLIGCGSRNEYQAPPPPEVGIAAPEVRDVETLRTFVGQLAGSSMADIRARVQGVLEEQAFDAGRRVQEGDLLFRIEKEPFEAALAAAEAALDRAKANAALAETTYERKNKLLQQEAISELEVLQAKAEWDAARAAAKEAEANVANARINLSYCDITAPFDGRMSRALVDIGNLVGGNGPALLGTLVREDPMYVYFDVSERDVLEFVRRRANAEGEGASGARNITVRLEFADGEQYPAEGQLDYAANQMNTETGTLTVRAVFPNEDGLLVSGLFARVQLPRENREAVLVPDAAVQRDIGGDYVLSVGEDNKVARVAVTKGDLSGPMRIITSGLNGDERIIVSGLQRARPGATVTPTNAASREG